MKLIILILCILVFGCGQRAERQFDFVAETGLSEDEFYKFLNETYSQKFDTIGISRVVFEKVGPPIKIEFQNNAPTEIEPPPIDFLKASHGLDEEKLTKFKLISKGTLIKVNESDLSKSCEAFAKEIGERIHFIHLPWYNPYDSTLLFKDVEMVCPPYFHQGQGVLYRFKRNKEGWNLIN